MMVRSTTSACRLPLNTILVVGLVLLITIVFYNTGNLAVVSSANGKIFDSAAVTNPYAPDTNRLPVTVIILQQSQVQESKQLVRLSTIDTSWAKWAKTAGRCTSSIRIVAAVPAAVYSSPNSSFVNLYTMPMFSPKTALSGDADAPLLSSPYHNFIRSLLTVASSAGKEDVKWVVLGNDHTFMIPPNLAYFLGTLDVDTFVYSGNELRMQYRRKVLSFASGGAGAVTSHVVVKLMLVVWFLTASDPLLISLLPALDAKDPRSELNSGINELWSNDSTLQWGSDRSLQSESAYSCSGFSMPSIIACGADGLMMDLRRSGPHVKCALAMLLAWVIEDGTNFSELQKSLGAERCISESSDNQQLKMTLRLSRRVRVVLARSATQEKTSAAPQFTLSLPATTSAGAAGAVTVTGRDLRRECTAVDKWTRTNPGIVMAHCLGILGIPFTPSTTINSVRRDAGADMTTHTAHEEAERFNVYGVLRTVLGDVDEWYLDGKRTAAEFNGTAAPSHDRRNTLLLAKDVVSFHYVSEVEARLLYDLLGADAASVHPATSGLRAGLAKGTIGDSLLPICPKKHPHPGKESVAVPCSSAREIRALWPDSDERAGHYSRPLSRGPTGLHEADLLYNYLSQVQVSKPPC